MELVKEDVSIFTRAEDLLIAWKTGDFSKVRREISECNVAVILYFGYLLGNQSHFALFHVCEELNKQV